MQLKPRIHFCIYRIQEKGLEIFLQNTTSVAQDKWVLPTSPGHVYKHPIKINLDEKSFELDPVEVEGGFEQAIAVEGDWHDIPSIRGMIRNDVDYYTDKIKSKLTDLPDVEQGSYVCIKDAFKKIMPHQYKVLKELKDVILDRNSVKYI